MKTFYERHTMYPLFEYLIFLLIAILVISPSSVSVYLRRFDISFVYSSITIVLLLFLYVSFRELEVKANPNELEFGFKIFRKRFPIEKVIGCEEFEIKFSNYLGWGIRFGLDGTIAYNTKLGKGAKVTIVGKKRPYVFNCNDPQGLCEFIQRAKESRIKDQEASYDL